MLDTRERPDERARLSFLTNKHTAGRDGGGGGGDGGKGLLVDWLQPTIRRVRRVFRHSRRNMMQGNCRWGDFFPNVNMCDRKSGGKVKRYYGHDDDNDDDHHYLCIRERPSEMRMCWGKKNVFKRF